MKRSLMITMLLLTCLGVELVSVQGQQRNLTPDQQHELKAWHDMGNAGDPPNFGKRFVKPELKDVERLVEDSWIVTFAYTVTDNNLATIAPSLAKKYGLKIRKDSLMKGNYARMALYVGPEDAARRLSEDPAVRIVEQDAIPKVKGLMETPPTQKSKPHSFKMHLPAPVKRELPSGEWAESIHDAIGAPVRAEFKMEDVVNSEELAAFRQASETSLKSPVVAEPEQGGRSPAGYWLDRLDSRSRSYDNIYRSRANGAGIDFYVVDSGVVYHQQFEEPSSIVQRVTYYRDAFNDGYVATDSHGTSVASTGAGKTLGTANGVNIISVRIYREAGALASDATWIQYLTDIRTRAATKAKNSVVNISIVTLSPSSGRTTALNNMLGDKLIVTGSCDYEFPPATVPGRSTYFPGNQGVLLVGMTTNLDTKFDTSNYFYSAYCLPSGPCALVPNQGAGCDLFTPGAPQFDATNQYLLAFGPTLADANGYNLYTSGWGTSFSAPIVGGIAAAFIQYNNLNYKMTVATVANAITKNASAGYVIGTNSLDNNKILYSYFGMGAVRNGASFSDRSSRKAHGVSFNAFETGATTALIRDPLTGLTYGLGFTVNTSGQINFTTPTGIPTGVQSVEFYNGTDLVGYGAIAIDDVAPGVFTLNAAGNGIANGQLLLVNKSNPADQQYVAFISGGNSWNSATHDAYIILYGTGWREQNGTNAVQILKGSTIWDSASNFSLQYVGPVGGYSAPDPALDQINFGPLPSSLLGQGTCDIKVFINGTGNDPNAVVANVTQVKFN